MWNVLGAILLAWWPIWGDPSSAIVGMQKLIARGPEDLVVVTKVIWGN